MRRLLQGCVGSILLMLVGAASVNAQLANRPVRLVVPYPPGGLVDTMARTLQEPLSAALGQQVVIDNKPGCRGAIATRSVAQSAPDGHTLIFGNNGPSALLPLIQKDAGYDPVADFAPISMVATAPMIIVVQASVPAKSLEEFIVHARRTPGSIAYSTAGVGSLGHLTSELFAQMAGLKLVHVPYKGSAPAVMAVLDGEVKMYLSSPSETLAAGIKAGKVRLLGVSTARPSDLAPGAAPIADVLAGFDVSIWYGVLGAKGTPVPVVERLNKAFREVLVRPDIQERFRSYGAAAGGSSPQELARLIADEVPKWRTTIESANITAQ